MLFYAVLGYVFLAILTICVLLVIGAMLHGWFHELEDWKDERRERERGK